MPWLDRFFIIDELEGDFFTGLWTVSPIIATVEVMPRSNGRMQAHFGADACEMQPAGSVCRDPDVFSVKVEPNANAWRCIEADLEVAVLRIILELMNELVNNG